VRIVLSSLGLSFFGRPPLRPRARAAFKPASVRSADQIALELSKRAKDMEYELPGRGSRVDLLGQRGETDAARLELVGQVNEVAEAAAQAVQPPDDQRIAIA
jgi:hypothetical protein